jgi:hypothetical protein
MENLRLNCKTSIRQFDSARRLLCEYVFRWALHSSERVLSPCRDTVLGRSLPPLSTFLLSELVDRSQSLIE